jgi:hypothetical protein
MKMKSSVLLLVPGLVALAGIVFLARPTAARSRCHRLNGSATLRASVVVTGCASPVGLCTAGEVHGDPVLTGTTAFVADGLAPAAGMPAVERPTTLSYSGLLTITTCEGTLTARDTGIFDTAAGLFASRDVVVGGTGRFAGASGHLFFQGTGTSSLDSDADGEICFAP